MTLSKWPLVWWCLAFCACSSAADTNGGSSATSPSSCDQGCQDNTLAYALDNTMWLLWNENFAGRSSGSQSLLINCPLGGTAQVTGTTSVASNGIDTIHLTFVLQNCENSNTTYSLAFTGTLTWDGTFSNTSANAVTFKSASLTIVGQVKRYDAPSVSETCAVSLTDTYDKISSSQSTWLNGEICGRAAAQ